MLVSIIVAVFLFLLGSGATIICFQLDTALTNRIPDFVKLGPAFVSAGVLAFPWKSVLASRARIACYVDLKDCFDHCNGGVPDEACVDIATEAMKAILKVD